MDKGIFFYALLLVIIYMMLYPRHHMISDEVYYAQQGVSFFQNENAFESVEWLDGIRSVRDTDIRNYKIGTGLVVGSMMFILGNNAQYLIGIFSLLVSILAVAFTLKKMGHSPMWSTLLVLSPVASLLCRTVMSDLPSLALSAVFVYLLIRNKRTIYENIGAAFIVGASYFFRETNVALLGLLSIPFLLKKNNFKLLYLVTATSTGLVFAYITTQILGEPLFSRNLGGLSFSLSNFLGNLSLYTLILTLIMPLGIIFILLYKGKHRGLFKLVSLIFVGIYLFYEYNGYNSSGAKGIFLNARFMLPLFPIVIIATADYIQQSKYYFDSLPNGVAMLGLFSFLSLNTVAYLHNEKQHEVVNIVKRNSNSIFTSDSDSYTLKYANYFIGVNNHVYFNNKQIRKCLLKGKTVMVIYSEPMESFKDWLGTTESITIEDKGSVTFLDNSTLQLISLSSNIEEQPIFE